MAARARSLRVTDAYHVPGLSRDRDQGDGQAGRMKLVTNAWTVGAGSSCGVRKRRRRRVRLEPGSGRVFDAIAPKIGSARRLKGYLWWRGTPRSVSAGRLLVFGHES